MLSDRTWHRIAIRPPQVEVASIESLSDLGYVCAHIWPQAGYCEYVTHLPPFNTVW